jgi:hypothetical protein
MIWLHPGLRALLRLRLRAALRMGIDKAKTPTGLLAVLALFGFLGSFLGIRVLMPGRMSFLPGDQVQVLAPFIFAVFWFAHITLRGGGEMLGFLPDEVDQLFAAPYSATQLLRYKLSLLLVAWTLTAVFMTPLAALYAKHALGGLLAALLVLPFLQLSSMCSALIRQAPASTLGRLVYLGGIVAIALLMTSRRVELGDASEIAAAVLGNPIGQLVMLPFSSAVGLLTAATPAGLVMPALVMLVVNALLAAFMLRLGRTAWLEHAAEGAAALEARLKKAQSGGVGELGTVWQVAVPRLPRLGGVGPIAWRRFVEVVRRPATLISLLVLVGLIATMALLLGQGEDVDRYALALTLVVSSLAWGVMLIPSTLRLDFRADLDRMDQLRALPISSVAIVVGQTLPMAVLLTVTEWVILSGIGALSPWSVRVWCAVAMAVVPVLAWFVITVENLFFLLLPVRIEAGEAALQSVGTNLVVTFGAWMTQGIVIAIVCGIGGAIGWFAGSKVAGTVVAVALFGLAAFVAVQLTAWRFRHFDPSRDVPG